MTTFKLESCRPDDRTLPKAPGKAPRKRKPRRAELDKLQATIARGGLVPERSEFLERLCRQLENKTNKQQKENHDHQTHH